MSRTFDADHILAALIEEYQAEGHLIFNQDGKVFVGVITAETTDGDLPPASKVDICLTSLAAKIAARLSI